MRKIIALQGGGVVVEKTAFFLFFCFLCSVWKEKTEVRVQAV